MDAAKVNGIYSAIKNIVSYMPADRISVYIYPHDLDLFNSNASILTKQNVYYNPVPMNICQTILVDG